MSNGPSAFDEKLAALRLEHMAAAGRHFDHWLARGTESLIEQLLLAQMFALGWGPNENPRQNWMALRQDIVDLGYTPTPWILAAEGAACFCVTQLPVILGPSAYRVDFAFIGRDAATEEPVRIAVELDGHDFHERTKEQASHDKRRDRAFTANGWTVLRFTGSDVYRDPGAVLEEIVRIGNKRCWPWMDDE